MSTSSLFLVLGATGGTGKHFVTRALHDGHRVRVLVRSLQKLGTQAKDLDVWEGSITDVDKIDTDKLVEGVDYVVSMLGDKELQRDKKINYLFMQKLVPSMRKQGVKRFLYQAGGLSKPYQGSLSWTLWLLRNTLASGFNGQHLDNEAVMEYLETQAKDLDWMVHRAGIISDGESKGTLQRSKTKFSMATHRDCADYSYRLMIDPARDAVHTSDFSCYV
ncbi:uncharacterized protein I303_108093 [Kwoniella dejecticola CBS 10117]|uniref:NAD(P)-binding domain-containing protein n=1 Tax=Kwoniella dejecticola CBS 10117 TaxID=1296121 RepID=A0A1A5ZWI6_9TREE|nr:uncharacterized protein I303_08084 [Kwoniella dejecticola CBS 10117]OBR82170.1 hypothetical protein I303_08084 [Kwoniella dejecticola CBS 10117]